MNPQPGTYSARVAQRSGRSAVRASLCDSRRDFVVALVFLASATLAAQAPYPQSGYGQQPYAQPSPQPQYSQQQAYGTAIDTYPDLAASASQPAPSQFFTADQLEQMLAPVALYPDGLLAQLLAAATYPAQVSMADQWVRTMNGAPPQQIAAEADTQNWDPSIKALTAFPQVLDMLAGNPAWTTDLGNAYYNQTQDVLQTVQVLRQRAQAAGTLQNSPQEQMSYDQGAIELAPPDPQTVYVPSYNPWAVYGAPVDPYPGFSLLGTLGSFFGSSPIQYGLGVAMSAFLHTPFGWMNWALDWLGNSVLFEHSTYYSRSPSVAHWAGSYGAGYNYRHGGYGGRQWQGGAYNQARGGYGPGETHGPFSAPRNELYGGRDLPANGFSSRGYPGRAPYQGGYGSAYPRQYAYSRSEEIPRPARPQQYSEPRPAAPSYARPAYGAGFYGSGGSAYGYGSRGFATMPRQDARLPEQRYTARNNFSQRTFAAPRAYSGYASKPEHSGGFHLFGGGGSHGSPHFSQPKAPKMPKSFGGGGHGGGHFGGHGGDHRR